MKIDLENFDFEKLDFKKIPLDLIFFLWIISIIGLMLPPKLLEVFYLTDFFLEIKKYSGLIFIFSTIILFKNLCSYLKERSNQRKKIKKIKLYLQNLNLSEIQILREFYFSRKDTIYLPSMDETVICLENKKIINSASSTGFFYYYEQFFPYTLSEYAKEEINNQKLLLPENPTIDEKQKIDNERPYWIIG